MSFSPLFYQAVQVNSVQKHPNLSGSKCFLCQDSIKCCNAFGLLFLWRMTHWEEVLEQHQEGNQTFTRTHKRGAEQGWETNARVLIKYQCLLCHQHSLKHYHSATLLSPMTFINSNLLFPFANIPQALKAAC